jgi:dipeptidase E
MKLMLTSDGFTNKKLFNEFVKLVDKPIKDIKIVIVPTAAKYRGDSYRKYSVRNLLIEFGILKKNTKILEIDKPVSYSDFEDFDSILVGGGNNYYLLDHIRKSGFDKVLTRFLEKGVYVGISAGSMVVGPNIEISKMGDKNMINLKDLTGLNYVDFEVAPHKDVPRFIERGRTEKAVKEFAKTVPYDIVSITDDQAVVVVDGKRKII